MKTILTALLGLFIATTAMAQDDYQIRPGDTLRVEVLEDPQLNRNVLVLPDGRFSFPFAGTVAAGGRSIGDVERSIANGIASNFATRPNVFVSVQSLRERRPSSGGVAARRMEIFFVGEVNTPGAKTVAPGTTFLQAIAQSGGFTRFAALKRVQLRRTGPDGRSNVYTVNYKAIANGAEMANDIRLQSGDVILVPQRRLFE